jgi:hypothetical protein
VPLRADKVNLLPVLWFRPNALTAGATVYSQSNAAATPVKGQLVRVPFFASVSPAMADEFLAGHDPGKRPMTFVGGLDEGFLPFLGASDNQYVGGKGWMTNQVGFDPVLSAPGHLFPIMVDAYDPDFAHFIGTTTVVDWFVINGMGVFDDVNAGVGEPLYQFNASATADSGFATRLTMLTAAALRFWALRMAWLVTQPFVKKIPTWIKCLRTGSSGPPLPDDQYEFSGDLNDVLSWRTVDDGTGFYNAVVNLSQQMVDGMGDGLVFTVADLSMISPTEQTALVADMGTFFGF